MNERDDEGNTRERRRWRSLARMGPGPSEVVVPRPGQESVWDFPRPPRLDRIADRVRVEHAGVTVADSTRAWRIAETASPPCYYLPPDDVRTDRLELARGRSFCEWKGSAVYWDLRVGERVVEHAAWSYPSPVAAFAVVKDHFAFYAGRLDACWVGEDRVQPQPGGFYGGWITPNLVGPFKGEPGTEGW